MLLTKRPGSFVARPSRRTNVTLLAGSASAFVEMKTRSVVVAAQSVLVSPRVRASAATLPPDRSPRAEVARVEVSSFTQSPQAGLAAEVVNSGQFASRNAW